MSKQQRTALIIGAGPAGLTAALELLRQTDIVPIVLEASADIGGISKTIKYKGNRIDIGGHRFFSKSDKIMAWWNEILPIEKQRLDKRLVLKYQGKSRTLQHSAVGADPAVTDEVMLVRNRLSRIYYGGKFYDYPVSLSWPTIRNLGLPKITRIGVSYVWSCVRRRPEKSLEDFYINRFGRELYNTFFRDYTEKVWGVPCSQIAPDWGAQRVKGLSVTKTLLHALGKGLKPRSLSQKKTETSLIEYFLYPKFGPGQMWETVAKQVVAAGGKVQTQQVVTKVHAKGKVLTGVTVFDIKTGQSRRITGDYVFSTMPVKELITAFDGVPVPKAVRRVAAGLPYRDFMTVGLLVKRLRTGPSASDSKPITDNWIYIQEPNVKVGRLQIFNNWSPYLVNDDNHVWVGMEYFVDEGDEFWSRSDKAMSRFAIDELVSIGLLDAADVLDSTVIRVKKTYPAYFGTYDKFPVIRSFVDSFSNLYLLGRNGQHRYNNQDHSMMTAMAAVDTIVQGATSKTSVWEVNVDSEYHEDKQ